MATKAEAINYIKANFKCEETGPDTLKVLIEYNSSRSQIVFVVVGEQALMLTSPFALEEDLTAKQALNAVSGGLFGVKIYGPAYALTHLLFVEDLDASEINKGIEFLASVADDLEQSLVGGDRL